MIDTPGLTTLGRAQCLRLLADAAVGRIVFSVKALPAIQPVPFALYDGAVVVRTNAGSRLAVAVDHDAVVAFEVDHIPDHDLSSGWSVVALGYANAVTAPDMLAEVAQLPLPRAAPDGRDHYLRISIEQIGGRRLDRHPTV